MVSTHSHPKVAAKLVIETKLAFDVSTHSHPKVAASNSLTSSFFQACFNTQPPEGGCFPVSCRCNSPISFNTQPPEGGCGRRSRSYTLDKKFQHTATRRWLLSSLEKPAPVQEVSTHSHPKVAATDDIKTATRLTFQHTATRRWLL